MSDQQEPDILKVSGWSIPVKVDPAMPADRIELRDGTKLICTVINVAWPAEQEPTDVCSKCGGDGGGHDAIPVCSECGGSGEAAPPTTDQLTRPNKNEYMDYHGPAEAYMDHLQQRNQALESLRRADAKVQERMREQLDKYESSDWDQRQRITEIRKHKRYWRHMAWLYRENERVHRGWTREKPVYGNPQQRITELEAEVAVLKNVVETTEIQAKGNIALVHQSCVAQAHKIAELEDTIADFETMIAEVLPTLRRIKAHLCQHETDAAEPIGLLDDLRAKLQATDGPDRITELEAGAG